MFMIEMRLYNKKAEVVKSSARAVSVGHVLDLFTVIRSIEYVVLVLYKLPYTYLQTSKSDIILWFLLYYFQDIEA